jgi:hypothetical protein
MLPIRDEEEVYEEVGFLVVPKPLEEIIVIFLVEKHFDVLVTSVSKSNRDCQRFG